LYIASTFCEYYVRSRLEDIAGRKIISYHHIVEIILAYLNTAISNSNDVSSFDVANEERAPGELSSNKSCKCDKRQDFGQHKGKTKKNEVKSGVKKVVGERVGLITRTTSQHSPKDSENGIQESI